MPVDLIDPVKMEELAEIIEGDGLESSLEGFIHSLTLPEEEAGAIVASLAQLPPYGGDNAVLPRKAPDLVRMAFWS